MENTRNKNKILFISLLFLFTGCISNNDRSFTSLLLAFDNWSFIHHPETLNNFDSYIFYIKNKKGDVEYFDEYFFDLKRFGLEISQIDKGNLSTYNKNRYISLNEKINSLLFTHYGQNYNRDPSYYINPVNWYLLNLFLSQDISDNDKLTLIDNTLNYLPQYFRRSKQSLLSSNDYFIEEGLNSLDITIQLVENIPMYIDIEDTLLKSIETKISQNKKNFSSYKKWLLTKLNKTNFLSQDKIKSFLNDHRANIETKYEYKDILYSLKLNIKELKKNIFNDACFLYKKDMRKDTLETYQDTLLAIAYIVAESNKKSNFNKDYASKIINFNEQYEEILSFIKSSNIIYDIEPVDIDFPHYNMIFDNFDKSIFITNPNYKNQEINVIINPSDRSNLSKTDISFFIIEEILTRTLYASSNSSKKIELYNNANHYAWSKILSRIMIENGYNAIDKNYKLIHNLNLLRDFTKILIKHEYYNGKLDKKEATNILLHDAFLDQESSNKIVLEIIYDYSKNDLEYYASYIYIDTLFSRNCILTNKISAYSFIKKIFNYGFLPVYNYKSILN